MASSFTPFKYQPQCHLLRDTLPNYSVWKKTLPSLIFLSLSLILCLSFALSLPQLLIHLIHRTCAGPGPVCPQIHSLSFPVSSYVSAGFWLGSANGNHWRRLECARRINTRNLLPPSLLWEASLQLMPLLLGFSFHWSDYHSSVFSTLGPRNNTSFHYLSSLLCLTSGLPLPW